MGVSALTVMNIQTNETVVIDNGERSELWILRDGQPHALMVSCPLEKRAEMEEWVAGIKLQAAEILKT